MPNSILDAIKQGVWDFEPEARHTQCFHATGAMPGTDRKLEVLAERIRQGLPLWHPSDRSDYDQIHSDYDIN
jgi:PAS domain-containing protein